VAAPSKGIRGPGTRSGSSSGVEVVGLAAFRKELRTLDDPKPWTRELGQVNRELAKKGAEWAQAAAVAMGGPQKHFAAAIKGYGSAASARIGIRDERAFGAFWGAKQRTGWNAGNQTPNQPEWVGNSWDAAVHGQGPYAINEALATRIRQLEALYINGIEDITRRAFPDAP
jgi:hypothetical protein